MDEKIQYPEIGSNYRHYKGGLYKVLTLAKHSETNETLVIYKSIHFGSVYARPLSMWFDIIKNGCDKIDGPYTITRFTLSSKY